MRDRRQSQSEGEAGAVKRTNHRGERGQLDERGWRGVAEVQRGQLRVFSRKPEGEGGADIAEDCGLERRRSLLYELMGKHQR